MSIINNIIGQNLKCIRMNLQMDQSEFYQILNVKQSQYSKIERGITPITVEKLFDIGIFLEIDPLELLKCRTVAIPTRFKPS